MRSSVLAAFVEFSAKLEGKMACLYLDTHDPPLVTTGIGNMVEPIEEALALPWQRRSTGLPATQQEIRSEWNTVKGLVRLSQSASSVWVSRAQLYLPPHAIETLVLRKLFEFETALQKRPAFVAFGTWPADAQLAALSMAWAMGVQDFDGFPRFESHVAVRDFAGAAKECKMDDSHNAGLKPRNAANIILFGNAAKVETEQLDAGTLFYPRTL